jgi:hypothetical protein
LNSLPSPSLAPFLPSFLRALRVSPGPPPMLEPERPAAVSPGRVLCLPTFNHFLIVNKLLSLSLSFSLSLSVHTHAHSDILRDSHSSPFSLVPGVFCSSLITPAWPLLVATSSRVFPCTYRHTPPRCLSHHNNEHTSHNCTFALYPMILGIHVGPGLHQHPRHRLVAFSSRPMQRGVLQLHMQTHATTLPQPPPP